VVWAMFDGVVDTPTLWEGIGATIGLGALLPVLSRGKVLGMASQIAVPVALLPTLAALYGISFVLHAVACVPSPSTTDVGIFSLAFITVVPLTGACFGLIFGMGSRDTTQFSKGSFIVLTLGVVFGVDGASVLIIIAAVLFWLGYVGYCGGSKLGGKLREPLESFAHVFTATGQTPESKKKGRVSFGSDIARPAVGFAFVYFYGVLWCGAIFYVLYKTEPGTYMQVLDSGKSVPLTLTQQASSLKHWWDFLFFSMMNVAPLGYSEIRPASFPARALAIMEAFAGTGWLVVTFGVVLAAVTEARSKNVGAPPTVN